MIQKFFEERKTKKFVCAMAQRLASDYGNAFVYTQGQVRTVFAKLSGSKRHESLVVAIFCDENASGNLEVDPQQVERYRSDLQAQTLGYGANGKSGADAGDVGDSSD